MNILFLTVGRFDSIEAHSIYADLLRCFRNRGHEVYVISPYEKRTGRKTELVEEKGAHVLHIETGDVTGSGNIIKKGLAQLSIESIYIKAIKKYFSEVKFDLVMYSTPPITFCNAVEFVKKRDKAMTYLLLKDIFPQNAVDLGMMTTKGLKGLIYRHFRNKERKLYAISDHIGCMSQANVKYVLDHNPEVDPSKVEICPNAVELVDRSVTNARGMEIREKYDVPKDRKVFIYGGNLGKPQGIPFLIDCLRTVKDLEKAYFLIIGSGTDYGKLESFINEEKPENVRLMKLLPKEDYDSMVGACDVGLIFLDHRFTIPNFPSRLLAYMQAKIPVYAVTDPNTDIGKIIEEGGLGWWSESNDTASFRKTILDITGCDKLPEMGVKGYEYMAEHYDVRLLYETITSHHKG